jgi:hypothetical protein
MLWTKNGVPICLGGDGIELPSGVYFYRLEASDVLEAGDFVATQKMVSPK